MYRVYRVNSRTPVRRPRRAWLESVKADMAEVEMSRKKWRRNAMKWKSYPIGKRNRDR